MTQKFMTYRCRDYPTYLAEILKLGSPYDAVHYTELVNVQFQQIFMTRCKNAMKRNARIEPLSPCVVTSVNTRQVPRHVVN